MRPVELVAAYAAFANGGSRVEPHLIRRVVDRNGDLVWEARPRTQRVLDPAVAFVLTTILEDVVDRGTGAAVRAAGFGAPAAGKTGTTNNSTDAWFVGYTPDLVAGIWIGFDDPKPIIRGASGGTLAAPTWGRMMRRIYQSRPAPSGWSSPGGVVTAEVDRTTGNRVNPECRGPGPVYTEYFIGRTPPAGSCWEPYDYPYAIGDSFGIYDSWDEFGVYHSNEYDTTSTGPVDWPELDELRRRAQEARNQALSGPDGVGPAEFDIVEDVAPDLPGVPVTPELRTPLPGVGSPSAPIDEDGSEAAEDVGAEDTEPSRDGGETRPEPEASLIEISPSFVVPDIDGP